MNTRCLAKRLMALAICLVLLLAPGFSQASLPVRGLSEEDSASSVLPSAESGAEESPGEHSSENGSEGGKDEPPAKDNSEASEGDGTDDEAGEEPPEPLDKDEEALYREDGPGLLGEDATSSTKAAAMQIASQTVQDAILAAQDEGVVPFATEISPTEIEVSTYTELAAAVANGNTYTDIYFANDIAADNTTPIIVGDSKTGVTIYGRAYADTNAENIFTFTQYPVSGIDYTFRVASNAVQQVTVRDMNIEGQQYYGVVGIPESITNVTTRYENVTYTGPQMCYNRNGRVEIVDCDITIVGRVNVAEEVAEAHNVTLGGTVNVNMNVSTNANSTFWITNNGTSPAPSFTVAPGANVTINSASYLWYADQGPANRPTVTIGENSVFTANTATGISRHFINYSIEPGATASFIQTASGDQGLRIRSFFNMAEGSSLYYTRSTGQNEALVRTEAAGAAITFTNPERVYLNTNNNALLFGGSASTIRFTTDAINLWSSGSDASSAPTQIWNKANGSGPLTATATFTDSSTFTATSNLNSATDPVDTTINNTTLALRGSSLITFGQILLGIDLVTDADTSITGSADPSASVTGTYTGAGGAGNLSGSANETGLYTLPVSNGSPVVGTTVYLTSYSNSLRMRQRAPVENAADYTLAFDQVPAALPFQTITVPRTATVVGRVNPNWTIIVQDNRPVSSGFRVQASIAQPLTANKGGTTYTMDNALVYVNSSNTYTPLSASPLTVYSNTTGASGLYPISWSSTQGPLVYATPGNLVSGVTYSTTIQWDLVDAP